MLGCFCIFTTTFEKRDVIERWLFLFLFSSTRLYFKTTLVWCSKNPKIYKRYMLTRLSCKVTPATRVQYNWKLTEPNLEKAIIIKIFFFHCSMQSAKCRCVSNTLSVGNNSMQLTPTNCIKFCLKMTMAL